MNFFVVLYEKTGIVGYLLILLALVAVYLFIRNSLYLRWSYREFLLFFTSVEQADTEIMDGRWSASNPLIGIVQGVADSHAAHSGDLRAEVAFLFHKHFQRVLNSMTALRLISTISPLLGLLGAVLGMIEVFRVVSMQASADSAIMAGGIWEALLTTIMGLAVAIPSLVFYYYLRMKMTGFQIEAVEYGYRTLGIINPECPYGKKHGIKGCPKSQEIENQKHHNLEVLEGF
jgi:biopolymer transport protein ExbB